MDMSNYNKNLKINGRDCIFPSDCYNNPACGNCNWFKDYEGHPVINGKIELRSGACGKCFRFPKTEDKGYFDLCGEWEKNKLYFDILIFKKDKL